MPWAPDWLGGSALRLGSRGGVDHQAFVLATREAFQAMAALALLSALLAWLARPGADRQTSAKAVGPQAIAG